MNILQTALQKAYGVLNDKLLAYFKKYGASSSVLGDAEKEYLVGKLGNKYIANQDYWRELNEKYGDIIPLEVSDILAKYGSDAHMWLPGIGTSDGFHTGNYQDSAGTTPATIDGSTGLVLDAAGSVGSELSPYASGFASLTGISGIGATVSLSGTELVATATSTDGSDRCEIPISGLTSGNRYQVIIVARRGAQGIQQGIRSSTVLDLPAVAVTSTSNATFTSRVTAIAASGVIRAYCADNAGAVGDSLIIVSISIKEITGIHATQATAGSKPTLRKGIVNLLTYSNTFSNAAWTKSLTVTTSGGVADPLGWNNASTLTGSGANSLLYNSNISATTNGCTAWWVRRRSGTGAIRIGTLAVTYTDIAVTSDWQLFVSPVATGQFGGLLQIATSGDQIDVFNAGTFAGTLTASQILAYGGIPLTTTVAASSSLGPNFWQFDGTDDSLGATFAAGTLPANADVFITVRRDSGTVVLAYSAAGVTNYLGFAQSGNGAQCISNAGSAYSVFVDGVQVGSVGNVTASNLSAALTAGVNHVLEMRNVNLSAWTGFGMGNWNTGFALKGSIAPVAITTALSDADRTTVRKYLAKWVGITL